MALIIDNKNLYRKRRYKPLYKQFIKLKKNVQYRRKIVLNYFKKWKWQNFLKIIKNQTKNIKKLYVMFDHNRYSIITFFRLKFKRKFNHKLQIKKKISLFYGNLLQKYLKKCIRDNLKKRNKIQSMRSNFLWIETLEKRLDAILYRTHFASSIRGARQLISHRHIYINKKLVTSNSYVLKQGDLIEVSSKFHNLIIKNLKSNHKWPIPPKYLQINYRTLQILFHDDVKLNNLSCHFPFKLDINTILTYYRN